VDIGTLSVEEFSTLPLVIEGESKEVRYAGNGQVVIHFKPTIYSYSANRSGILSGSNMLRLKATQVFLEVLAQAGIRSEYLQVNDRWALANLVLQPALPNQPIPFRPDDISLEEIARLRVAPPIEVIVKRYHSGTSKHRYHGMAGFPVRSDHPLYRDMSYAAEDAYPEPIVRFDWRNPLHSPSGERLADEALADQMAEWFIDTKRARATALRVYDALSDFLADRDIVCYDLCLFVTQDGDTVFGEVSQDCGRFRHFDLGSLDKDVWRSGGSGDEVLAKWALLLEMISK